MHCLITYAFVSPDERHLSHEAAATTADDWLPHYCHVVLYAGAMADRWSWLLVAPPGGELAALVQSADGLGVVKVSDCRTWRFGELAIIVSPWTSRFGGRAVVLW